MTKSIVRLMSAIQLTTLCAIQLTTLCAIHCLALQLLMAASSQDVDDQCRAAAQASLAAIPLSAELLIPLLELTPQDGQASPGPSKRKRRLSDPKSPKGSQSVSEAAVSGGFSTCLATLEVLQWRDDVAGSLLLVPCLETTAQTLLEKCIAVQTQEEGDDTSPEAIGVQAAQAYGMQLALARLLALAQQHSRAAAPVAPSPAPKSAKKSAAHKKAAHVAHASPFDLAIAVRCTQLAPDASVRSVALQLVSTLAAAQPEAALAHVLDIVAVVGDSSVELIDAHSNAVAAQALVAVASAWTQGGSPLDDLVNAVTSAVAGAPPTRRLPLLSALASALPEAGLCMIVLLLLERRLAAQGDAAEGVAWALDVASSLLQQVSVGEGCGHLGGRGPDAEEETH